MEKADAVLCFKAMADETRLSIIDMLSRESLCACHILEEFNITQPTLSYHMKILVESNIVLGEKDALNLTEKLEGVECLLITKDKRIVKSSGFSNYEN